MGKKVSKKNKKKKLTKKQKKILENRKIIIITVISIICLLTLVLVSTYAVLVTRKSSNQKDLYKTGNLSVDFLGGSSNIYLQKAIPTSDDIGSKYKPYTFDIKSGESAENNYSSKYTVRLVPNATTNMSLDKIKIKVNDDDPVLLSSFTDNIIDSGILQKNETKIMDGYRCRYWSWRSII